MGLLKVIAAVGVSFILLGCTSAARTMLAHSEYYKEVDPKRVRVYIDQPPKKAKPIAVIAISRVGENAVWAVEVLKMEAAEIGADAVTNLEMNYSPGFFPTLRVQGLAVKYE